MVENRTVLFLYPDFENYDTAEQKLITKLISDLKIIINYSNNRIGKVLQDGSFSYIRCLPFIEMEEATKQPTPELVDLVRVCVIGYDDKNYESIYSNICEDYVRNKLEITHLVGLKIVSNMESIRFTKPAKSPFDVVIETNLRNLDLILISIMLDTSIYHYFSLSEEVKYRKNFSTIKIDGIKESNNLEDYGEIIEISNINYLPFSYPFVKRYFSLRGQNKNEQSKDITDELIKEYFSFIKNWVCTSIDYNTRKERMNPYQSEIKPNIKKSLDTIVKYEIIKPGKTYLVAINMNIEEITEDSINNKGVFVIEVSDLDSALHDWLSLFNEPLTNYSLFQIKIGA